MEPRAETRDMVWALVRLIADDAPPQRVEASARFALRALAVRQELLSKERRLAEAILKWQGSYLRGVTQGTEAK